MAQTIRFCSVGFPPIESNYFVSLQKMANFRELTLLADNTGKVYVSGSNANAQLGNGLIGNPPPAGQDAFTYVNRVISSLSIVSIAAGSHSVVAGPFFFAPLKHIFFPQHPLEEFIHGVRTPMGNWDWAQSRILLREQLRRWCRTGSLQFLWSACMPELWVTPQP